MSPSKIFRVTPCMRSSPSAASVPISVESTAVQSPTSTLVHSAFTANGLEKAFPYHSTEKPCQSMA